MIGWLMAHKQMGHKRFSQILGLSVVASLMVASGVVAYSLIQHTIAQQTNQPLCIRLRGRGQTCYRDEFSLSEQATTALAASPDGRLLASGAGKVITLYPLASGTRGRSLHGHTDWITTLAFSPDGKTLASGSLDGSIRLWNLQTGTLQTTLYPGNVTAIAFSPDGRTLATSSRLIKTLGQRANPIQLWDLATRQPTSTLDPAEAVTALAFSPDGRFLAAGTATTKVWSLQSQRLLHVLDSGELNTLLFSREGDLLITGSNGVQGEDGIKVWLTESGKLVQKLDSVAADLALTPDGKTLLSTYGGTANLWQMRPLHYLGTLRGSVYSGLLAEFGPDGGTVILGSSEGIFLWRGGK